jgi:hypothetical protein
MLIEDLGRQLACKPFEWMSWWWGVKWGGFIEIFPQLSKENPLWLREQEDLENLRLCRKTPDELQQQIASYWQKPFWRRWLLRLFTDINSRIVIYSYYQRCLSFQRIHQENPLLERRLILYEREQHLVNLFISELKRDHSVLEQRLEGHIGNVEWMNKNFDLLLAQHEEKRQRFFLRLLDRHLKELPVDADRASVQRKLEDEYSALGKVLRNYFQHWCQPVKAIEENPCQDLVSVSPAVVVRVINPSLGADLNCSMSSINEWLALKQYAIEKMLKENPPAYEAIQLFLQHSLQSLEGLLEPLLSNYERLVGEARHKRVNYKEMLKWSDHLQSRFTYFFRHSSLLFHPDRSGGDKIISQIKTELFQEFQQLIEISFDKLNRGLVILKQCIPSWELELAKLREKLEQDLIIFREELNQWSLQMKADNAEIRAEQAEIKAEQTEIKAEQAEIKKTLEILLKRTSTYVDSEDETVSPEPTTHPRFF